MNKSYWGDESQPSTDEKNSTVVPIEATIQAESNHVYFYKSVDSNSVLELNKLLQQKTNELLKLSNDIGVEDPVLYLHINSGGGYIFDGTAAMDTIIKLKSKINITTVVDGMVASAATFMSVVGTKRIMHRHSYMLIHQLSGASWGNYRELKDDMKNNDEFMRMIKEVYKKYTKVLMKDIDEILDHDIWWDANKCLEMGLVDEIWGE